TLEQQAADYAEHLLADYPSVFGMMKKDIGKFIAKAYAQGWVDRDTRDLKPETKEEFFGEEKGGKK
ncbi:MAG: hypothetical protein NC548_62860, partial [Lachnospiraceae bacterium]|nr:hypothetical protein [Lachnospiraceae bacterium]